MSLPAADASLIRIARESRAKSLGWGHLCLAVTAILVVWLASYGGRAALMAIACGLTLWAGMKLGQYDPQLVPLAVVAVLLVVIVADFGEVFSDSATSGPFGYANAKGALFVQGLAAALTLSLVATRTWMRRLALVCALVFAIIPITTGALAASVSMVAVVGLFATRSRLLKHIGYAACAAVFVAVLGATMIIGAGFDPSSDALADSRRVDLWRDATQIMLESPVRGAGPGGFARLSPEASVDADASWAHNEFLQIGAEYGVTGLVLVTSIVMLLVGGLFVAGRGGHGGVLIVGAGLIAFATQATVDYVGHFPLLIMTVALLCGSALGGARRAEWNKASSIPGSTKTMEPTTARGRATRSLRSESDVLRILIVIKGLGRGGAEQLLVNGAPYLDRQRFHYEFAYVLPYKDALVGRLEDYGFTVHCLGSKGPRWIARLRTLVRSKGFDLVHLHSPLPAVAARMVLGGSRRPVIVSTEHNVWGRYHRATYWANRLTFNRNDHVFAVSDEVRHSIQPLGGGPARAQVPTETLYHGPDQAAMESLGEGDQVRAEFNISESAPVVGTVANFKAHKGYPYLLEAAAKVRRAVPDVRFLLVGQGPLEPKIKEQAVSMGLGDAIVFAGFREDVPRIMSSFDVFALSSLHEGLSIALLEAMSLGKPPVVTRVGGLPEVVGEREGFVVPPKDPEALASSIIQLLQDPKLRSELGENARARAAGFDISKTVARTEAVYRRLLK